MPSDAVRTSKDPKSRPHDGPARNYNADAETKPLHVMHEAFQVQSGLFQRRRPHMISSCSQTLSGNSACARQAKHAKLWPNSRHCNWLSRIGSSAGTGARGLVKTMRAVEALDHAHLSETEARDGIGQARSPPLPVKVVRVRALRSCSKSLYLSLENKREKGERRNPRALELSWAGAPLCRWSTARTRWLSLAHGPGFLKGGKDPSPISPSFHLLARSAP